MKGKFGDKQRLQHMLDACTKILLATKEYDLDKFVNDFIITAATHTFIMIIGEAAASITKEFKDDHPGFDWALMKGMRNIIVHEYFGVDDYRVWDTIVNDIPKLKINCENALKELNL